jgi:hypothetical protein
MPRSPERLAARFDEDFKLDSADVKEINALDKKPRFNDASESFR